jgi:hypothetical protein
MLTFCTKRIHGLQVSTAGLRCCIQLCNGVMIASLLFFSAGALQELQLAATVFVFLTAVLLCYAAVAGAAAVGWWCVVCSGYCSTCSCCVQAQAQLLLWIACFMHSVVCVRRGMMTIYIIRKNN